VTAAGNGGRFAYNGFVNPRISIDPKVQHGRPVIKGTRVPVVRILGELAGGASRETICEQYGVTTQDIVAAVEYASELVEAQQQRPVPV